MLKAGDKIQIIVGADELFQHCRHPDEVLVLKDYAYFYLCRAIYRHSNRVDSYRFCINKVSLRIGEIKISKISELKAPPFRETLEGSNMSVFVKGSYRSMPVTKTIKSRRSRERQKKDKRIA